MTSRSRLIPLLLIALVLALAGCHTDPAGLDESESAPALGDKKPPDVEILHPADGDTVAGTIVIAAEATDKRGVDSVEFFINGIKEPDATDTVQPFEYEWDTRSVPSGNLYVLTARATDPSGNSAVSDPIQVMVINGVSPAEAKVIVLLIDGARYTETFGDPDHTYVPSMWNTLRPMGTTFADFRNEGVTSTNPGHASVESGRWEYIANDGSERPAYPTFFEYFRSARGTGESGNWVVAGKAKLDICTYSTFPAYGSDYRAAGDAVDRDDEETFQALIGHLQADHPRLALVNFARVDRAGHSGIWNDYVGAIATADSLVLELWRFLETDQFYAGTTYLIVTNDHGRHTTDFTSHGDGCEGCRHLMCLIVGPDIKRGLTITQTHTMLDLCPTIGTIFDIPTPYAAGTPLHEVFTSSATGIADAGAAGQR